MPSLRSLVMDLKIKWNTAKVRQADGDEPRLPQRYVKIQINISLTYAGWSLHAHN